MMVVCEVITVLKRKLFLLLQDLLKFLESLSFALSRLLKVMMQFDIRASRSVLLDKNLHSPGHAQLSVQLHDRGFLSATGFLVIGTLMLLLERVLEALEDINYLLLFALVCDGAVFHGQRGRLVTLFVEMTKVF